MASIVVVPKFNPMSLVKYTGHNEAEIQEFTGLETKKAEDQDGSSIAFMFHDTGPRLAKTGDYVNKFGIAYSERVIQSEFEIVDVTDAL